MYDVIGNGDVIAVTDRLAEKSKFAARKRQKMNRKKYFTNGVCLGLLLAGVTVEIL